MFVCSFFLPFFLSAFRSEVAYSSDVERPSNVSDALTESRFCTTFDFQILAWSFSSIGLRVDLQCAECNCCRLSVHLVMRLVHLQGDAVLVNSKL